MEDLGKLSHRKMLNSFPSGACSEFQVIKGFVYSSANTSDLGVTSDSLSPRSSPGFHEESSLCNGH